VKKLVYLLPVAILILAATVPAIAQTSPVNDGGCVDSPENPTAILALLGMAAAGFNQLRMRFGRRK
jgi:XrtJ-associated TM-motif-TM protein